MGSALAGWYGNAVLHALSRSPPSRPGVYARASARIRVAKRRRVRDLELGKAMERVRRPKRVTDATPPLGRYYDVEGRRLFVHRSGSGEPPVVLLAGAGTVGLDYLIIPPIWAPAAAQVGPGYQQALGQGAIRPIGLAARCA